MNEKILTAAPVRKNWIDFIKAFCTFFVVSLHSISGLWTNTSPDTLLWKLSHIPFLFGRIAVLLFFMCSGSTMLKKERSISDILRKYILQILKIYFFWMLIYGFKSCISLYNEGLATLRTCMNALAKSVLFGHYHTWFLFTLISLYLVTPFLCHIVKNKKHTEYFLILSVIFTFFIPTLQSIDSRLSEALSNLNMTFVIGYILYYVAGYYISELEWKPIYSHISVFLFIISFGAAYILTSYKSAQTGIASFDIFGNFSFLAFLSTISFFGIIRGLESFTFPRIISQLTSLGFGIYLMHPLFIEYLQPVTGYKIFLIIPLFYLFCTLICHLLNKWKVTSFFFIK